MATDIVNSKDQSNRRSVLLSSLNQSKVIGKGARNFKNGVYTRNMNLPAWLLIVFAALAGMCTEVGFNIVLSLATEPEASNCFDIIPEYDKSSIFIVSTLQTSLFCILYPFTGWLADVKIGRERAINFSLWSCWFGTLLQVISYCIQYGTCGVPVNVAKYGISGVALLLLMLGTAGFFTNIPSYGLDQLNEKSNTHTRAFIHWVVWGIFAGYLVGYIAFVDLSIYNARLLLITGLFVFTFASFALCLHAWFYFKFELTGVLKKNPYKMVFKVLKYAKKHKHPESRSALTYWESNQPSRLDLGKEKYGGPFKVEDVEDVKTFWRIVIVLVSLFGFYIPYYDTVIGILPYINSFKGAKESLNGYGSYVLWDSFDETVILYVPILEIIIIPLFPKIEYFLLKPLRGIGLTYLLILITLITMFILELVGHFVTNSGNGLTCFISITTEESGEHDISFLYYCIPLFFSGLADSLGYIFGLEFICSQAPSNMSGMVLGIFWFMRAFYTNIGALIKIPFSFLDLDGPRKLSCVFWILLLQITICCFGIVIFILVSRWYQHRKKGEDYDIHAVLEATYERVFDHSELQTSLDLGYVTITDVDYAGNIEETRHIFNNPN